MKKIIVTNLILGALVLSSGQAMAAPKGMAHTFYSCPFQDVFNIQGSYGTIIANVSSTGNVAVQQQTPVDFSTGCNDNNVVNDGTIDLMVSSPQGQCQLTITDGPYEMNPIINSVSCSGSLQYKGMNHPYGSYQYSLMFS